jgi:hypothetical protein
MNYGYARRALRGHNHFVSDVVISSDGQFALSGMEMICVMMDTGLLPCDRLVGCNLAAVGD